MRIKCPHCNGKGFSELNSAVNMTCGWCMGKGELNLEIVPIEPQTEQEYLQSLGTRELAKELALLVLYDMPLYDRLHNVFEGGESAVIDECEKWLKQPHREE